MAKIKPQLDQALFKCHGVSDIKSQIVEHSQLGTIYQFVCSFPSHILFVSPFIYVTAIYYDIRSFSGFILEKNFTIFVQSYS